MENTNRVEAMYLRDLLIKNGPMIKKFKMISGDEVVGSITISNMINEGTLKGTHVVLVNFTDNKYLYPFLFHYNPVSGTMTVNYQQYTSFQECFFSKGIGYKVLMDNVRRAISVASAPKRATIDNLPGLSREDKFKLIETEDSVHGNDAYLFRR